jgi:hypothetical protein
VAAELGGGRQTGSEPAIGATTGFGVEVRGCESENPELATAIRQDHKRDDPRAIGTSSHFQDESGNEAV